MSNTIRRVLGERLAKSLVVVVAMTVLGGSVGHSAFGQPTYQAAFARSIGLMIAEEVAIEVIKMQVKSLWKQVYPHLEFTDARFNQAYRAGLIALQQAQSDPSPSLADCQTDLYRAANQHCDN